MVTQFDLPQAHLPQGLPLIDDDSADDEPLAVSPPDVVLMLGFDPIELAEQG